MVTAKMFICMVWKHCAYDKYTIYLYWKHIPIYHHKRVWN